MHASVILCLTCGDRTRKGKFCFTCGAYSGRKGVFLSVTIWKHVHCIHRTVWNRTLTYYERQRSTTTTIRYQESETRTEWHQTGIQVDLSTGLRSDIDRVCVWIIEVGFKLVLICDHVYNNLDLIHEWCNWASHPIVERTHGFLMKAITDTWECMFCWLQRVPLFFMLLLFNDCFGSALFIFRYKWTWYLASSRSQANPLTFLHRSMCTKKTAQIISNDFPHHHYLFCFNWCSIGIVGDMDACGHDLEGTSCGTACPVTCWPSFSSWLCPQPTMSFRLFEEIHCIFGCDADYVREVTRGRSCVKATLPQPMNGEWVSMGRYVQLLASSESQ